MPKVQTQILLTRFLTICKFQIRKLKKSHALFYINKIKWLYTDGAENANAFAPDGYTLDYSYIHRESRDKIFLDNLRDYGSNIQVFEKFQKYLIANQPKLLWISGKNNKIFIAKGAELLKRAVRNAKINLINGGHFVLEEKHQEVATKIKAFFAKQSNIWYNIKSQVFGDWIMIT